MAAVREYVLENFKLSLGVWDASERMSTLIGMVLAAAATAVLATFGYAIEIRGVDKWQALLAIWFVVLFVFVTPFRMWKKQKQKIEAFEDAAKPRVQLVGPTDLFLNRASDVDRGLHIVRLEVRNISAGVIRNCCLRESLFVNRFGKASGQRRFFRLATESGADLTVHDHTKFFDLQGYGSTEILEIAYLDEAVTGSNVVMLYATEHTALPLNSIPQDFFPHDLTVSISADNLPEIMEKTYRLEIRDGQLRMTEAENAQ